MIAPGVSADALGLWPDPFRQSGRAGFSNRPTLTTFLALILLSSMLAVSGPAYAAAALSAVVSDDDMNEGKRKAVLSLSGHSGTWRLCLPGVTGNGRTMSETATFTHNNLDPATTYTYKAKGLGTSACQSSSNVIASATVEALPAIDFKRAYESAESIVLVWTELEGTGIQYKIGHKLSSASTYGTSRTVIDDGVFTIEPLSSGTYDVRLKAENSSGQSITRWSYLTNVAVAPAQVTGLSATKTATGAFRATWSAVSGVDSYDLEWQGVGEDETVRTESITSGTSFEKSGLIGHNYSIRIRAVKGTGSSRIFGEYSSWVGVSVREPLGKVTISEIESSEAGKFTINWNSVTDASQYRISWRGLGGYDEKGGQTGAGGDPDINDPTTTYTTPDSKKLTGYAYAVKVRAGGSSGREGPWSDEVRVDVCTLKNHNDATKCGSNLNEDGTPKATGLEANRPETLGWKTFNNKVVLEIRPLPKPTDNPNAHEGDCTATDSPESCPNYNSRYIGKQAPTGLSDANNPDITHCTGFGQSYSRNISDSSDLMPYATWTYEARETSCDGRLLNSVNVVSTPPMIVASPESLTLQEGGPHKTFKVRLGVEPPASVTITLTKDHNDIELLDDDLKPIANGIGQLRFTTTATSVAEKVFHIRGKNDNANAGDRKGTITLVADNEYFRNGGPYEIDVTVEDEPLPTATVEGLSALTVEGGDIQFRVELSPAEYVNSDIEVRYQATTKKLNDTPPHQETKVTCPKDVGKTIEQKVGDTTGKDLAYPDFLSSAAQSPVRDTETGALIRKNNDDLPPAAIPQKDLRINIAIPTHDDDIDEACGQVVVTVLEDDANPPTYLIGNPPSSSRVLVIDNEGDTAPPSCPAEAPGTYPNCVCTDSSKSWNGSMCETIVVPPPLTCPTEASGTHPNCTCPSGKTYNQAENLCKVIPLSCPAGATGTHPNCSCPSGQTYNQAQNVCEDPPPPPGCPSGQHEHDGRSCHSINQDHNPPPPQTGGGGGGGGSANRGPVTVKVTNAVAREGEPLTFNVVLEGEGAGDMSFRGLVHPGTATEGVDYAKPRQPFLVSPRFGSTAGAFMEVGTMEDAVLEGNETIRLELSPEIGSRGREITFDPPFAKGTLIDIDGPDAIVPLVPSAGGPEGWQGFVRVVNEREETAQVELAAVDEAGVEAGRSQIVLEPGAALTFNSDDLEKGRIGDGIDLAIGSPSAGHWRLDVRSEEGVRSNGYMRVLGAGSPVAGFVTSLSGLVPEATPNMNGGQASAGALYLVPFLNPGSNFRQESLLRIANPGSEDVAARIRGIDDSGAPGAGFVSLSVPSRKTLTLTAAQLETGEGLDGALGDGKGKWRLEVSSDRPLLIQSLMKTPEGLLSNLSAAPGLPAPSGEGELAWTAPLFPSASDPLGRQGFVRVTSLSEAEEELAIEARDESRRDYGKVMLTIPPKATVAFNSDDLELGNEAKGLSGSTGPGEGDWRLTLRGEFKFLPRAYLRTQDGFLSEMHGLLAEAKDGDGKYAYHAPIFNPASNERQVSLLLLQNDSYLSTRVSIRGWDKDGMESGEVRLQLSSGSSRVLTAQDLESGAPGVAGTLGNGNGKWRLKVTSDRPIRAMSLLRSPTGHITNLSAGTEP